MEEKRIELRTFLVKIFDQLSDEERQAFHRGLGNRIPREYRNQCTRAGSLKVLDNLFEQNIINEEKFDDLIGIFERIPCHRIVDQLREYELKKARSPITENEKKRRFSQEFKLPAGRIEELLQIESSSTPVNANTLPDQTLKIDSTKKKTGESFYNKHRLFIWIIIFLIVSNIFFVIFLIYFAVRAAHIPAGSTSVIKQNYFSILKEGLSYGTLSHLENDSFNDAKDQQLSYADQCIGIEIQTINFTLTSIRFLYSNDRPSNGNDKFNSFMLDPDEMLEKINLYQNPIEGNSRLIGIQFQTNKERKSDVFGSDDGHFLSESFELFTFAYARGIQRDVYGIEMLRFSWKKSVSSSEKINTVYRSTIEICQFTFIGAQTLKIMNVTGRESSWYDLKRQFNRQGGKLNFPASYYRKISDNGPELFAIRNDRSVYYQNDSEWHKYTTARDIECHLRPSSGSNSAK